MRIRTAIYRIVNSCSVFVILSISLRSRKNSAEEQAAKLISPAMKEASIYKMRYIAMRLSCTYELNPLYLYSPGKIRYIPQEILDALGTILHV